MMGENVLVGWEMGLSACSRNLYLELRAMICMDSAWRNDDTLLCSHLSQDPLTRKSVKQCVLLQSFAVTLHLPSQNRFPKQQMSILSFICAKNSFSWAA